MNIKITGASDARDGYGEITQNLALALDKLGHKVWLNPVKIWYRKESLKPRTIELMEPNKPDFELIIMYPVYDFGMIHKKAAILTMYEAHKCPDVWAKKLNQLRLPVIAPSQFVQDMFKKSKVTVPISVLTLGVDSEFYAPMKREFPEGRPFRFLTVGKLEPRKNIEAAVRCFQDAFFNEKVELLIKTRERFLPVQVRRIIQSDHRIKVIEKTLPEDELRKLYYYADAFLYPSRGEGFAFPPRNAVSTGMPTLVTDWSALAEIPGAIKIPVVGLGPMPPCGFSYGQEKELHMANIDEPRMMYEMFCLATDKEYYEKSVKGISTIKQPTWEDCAKNLIKIIER